MDFLVFYLFSFNAYIENLILEICFDFFNHFAILGIGEEDFAGVHLEDSAVFVAALVFRNEVEMKVAACITVCAVVYLFGVECLMESSCGVGNVCEEQIALLLGNIYDLAYVILVCYYYSAGLGLLLKEDEAADTEVADVNSKLIEKLASHIGYRY